MRPAQEVETDEEMDKSDRRSQDADDAEGQNRKMDEEKRKIILFNCGEYVEFADGAIELPTRITCYCRHHKEKQGFQSVLSFISSLERRI